MTRTDQQRRIDDIAWYHELDFGHGLKSRSREEFIEHCCHPDATVVVEGDVTHSLARNLAYINLPDPYHSVFIPTVDVLQQMFETAYFTVTSVSFVSGRRRARAPSRAAQLVHTLLGRNQTWRLVNRGGTAWS
jgi:hypothetical protein